MEQTETGYSRTELEQALHNKEQYLVQVQLDYDQLIYQNISLKQEIEQLQPTIQKLHQQLAELHRQVAQLQAGKVALETERNWLKQTLTNCQADLEALRATRTVRLTRLLALRLKR